MKTKILFILLFAAFITSCSKSSNNNSEKTSLNNTKTEFAKTFPKYAKGFQIKYFDNYKVLEVKNSWDTTKLAARYILVNKGNAKPSGEKGEIIEVPVKSMACVFTTHIGYALKLGVLDAIKGVCEPQYIKTSEMKKRVEAGKVINIGPSTSVNIEKLISVEPDIVFVSPFKDNKYGKIQELGIPLAVSASYMETSPLARSEWIKFMAYFFNKEKEAEEIFDKIADNYNSLKAKTKNLENKPTIFSNKRFGQVWFIPGGNSYMANFFKDAGADYLWKENQETGSLALDYETVFDKAHNADFWSITANNGGNYSYRNLLGEYEAYKEFAAFQNRKIILCNTHVKPYYETGLLEPDIILSDFIKVFHPELLPEYQPVYFDLMKQESR